MRVIRWAALWGPDTVGRTPWGPYAIIIRPAPIGRLVGDVRFAPGFVRFTP